MLSCVGAKSQVGKKQKTKTRIFFTHIGLLSLPTTSKCHTFITSLRTSECIVLSMTLMVAPQGKDCPQVSTLPQQHESFKDDFLIIKMKK